MTNDSDPLMTRHELIAHMKIEEIPIEARHHLQSAHDLATTELVRLGIVYPNIRDWELDYLSSLLLTRWFNLVTDIAVPVEEIHPRTRAVLERMGVLPKEVES